jgi:hypothetical protein
MAFPVVAARNADNVYASTDREFSSDVKDQTFKNMPAFRALFRQRGTGTLGNGRHEIRCETGLNDNAGTLRSDADRARFSVQQNHVVGYYDYMAFNYVPVQRSMIRESQNSGAAQIFSLKKADFRIASNTLRRMLNTQAIAGNGDNGTIIGLPALLPSAGVGTNSLFGISEVGNAWWKNVVSLNPGSWAQFGPWGSVADDRLLTFYLNMSDSGAEFADLILSDRTTFQRFLSSNMTRVSINRDSEFGKIGMTALTGTAGEGIPYYGSRWVYDNDITTGTVYAINTEDVRLIVDPHFDFTPMPVNLGDQFLLSGTVWTHRAQSEMNRRNRSGVQTPWTA